MRIGIDVRKINDFGIGTYIQNLIKYLLEADKLNQYFLFFNHQDINSFNYPKEQVIKLINNSPKYSIREHFSLSHQAQKYNLQLFHEPHYTLPYFLKCKKVVSIHDLIHLKFPQNLPNRRAYIYAKFMIGQAIKKADKILAGSENTKNDMVEIFKTKAEKIEVIYYGVDEIFKPLKGQNLLENFKNKYKLTNKYILYSGSIRKHKNLENALRAYALLKDESYHLVIAGVGLQNQKDLEPLLNELKIAEKVKITPFLDYSELVLLYNSASVLFFPTLYEGFGLPVLEAMACGIPVISSNNSSIAEVSAEAAILVDPLNLKKMADALEKVLEETSLRQRMVSLGLERAKIFSWEKTAQATLRVYRELLQN
ncbi:MAG: hypothetical protein A2145_04775 [candidate division Zixibacteria bacterium RBG_16_40_9]|nr:MAG: hypothetical protein A2145_04775 [candidate division Zixibacteria bacterium RBG_16_40_9]